MLPLLHLPGLAELMSRASVSASVDESGEGVTAFRRSPSGLVSMVGAPGGEANWKPVDEADVLAAVAELAQHNRGAPAALGQIIWSKRSS